MDRKINFLFFFLLIGIFVFATGADEHWQIITGAVLSVLFCLAAFLGGALSLDGMKAAMTAGTYIFGLGGIPAAAVVLLFFLSGSLISRSEQGRSSGLFHTVRRSGLQVWANSFWFVTFLACAVIWDVRLFTIGALGALATAMSDTWATELGSRRFDYDTFLVTSLKRVSAGTEGGVSLPGFTAAFAGSLLFSLVAVQVFSLELPDLLCIFVAGFTGSLLDSYLGAAFQRKNRKITVPSFGGIIKNPVDNNVVNLLSTGGGSLIAIILKVVFV